jgi:hypothetical protein
VTLEQLHEALELALRAPHVAELKLGLTLSSRANARGFSRWTAKANATQRNTGMWAATMTRAAKHLKGAEWLVVRWTRVYSGRSRAFDDDNATTALKSIRDGFARELGVDDSSDLVRYLPVEQVRGPRPGLTIRLYRKAAT